MNKKKIIISVIIAVCMLFVCIVFINNNSKNKNSTDVFDCNIEIIGKYNKNVDCKNLKGINIETKTFTMKASANKENTDTFKVMKMTDFLNAKDINDYKYIVVYAEDGFKAKIEQEDIKTAYFGIKDDEKQKEKNFRSIVPNKGSKFWVKNIVKIEVG